jgi:Tfp pilus assembly protein PilN
MLDQLKQHLTPSTVATKTFLPEEFVRERAESRANVLALVLFGVVLFGVVGAFLVTNRAWSSVRERQTAINEQYAEQTKKIELLKQLEKQKADMLDRAEVTTALLERVPRSILLAEVVNRMPEELTLTDFNLASKRIREVAPPPDPKAKRSLSSKGKGKADEKAAPARPRPPRMEFTVQLTGLAPADESVADFQASLKECGLLEQVDLISSQETVVDGLTMRRFRVEARIRPGADARNIEPLKIARRNGTGLGPASQPVAADGATGILGRILGAMKPVASAPESSGQDQPGTGER